MKNIEKYKDIVLDNLDACSISERLSRKMVKGYCGGFDCKGCRERVLKWLLEEAKEPILDDVEREYLSAVIKPFRNRVDYIVKEENNCSSKEFIHINLSDGDIANFPNFKFGTMYKGMEVGKYYTPEELGL